MRVSKKNVFLIIIFIVSLGLIYLIVSSFYFTSLHFKYFYELNETSNVAENKVIYTIMDNENIVYLNKKKDKIIIKKIEPNNVKPELIFEIEIPSNELETYSFIKKGTYHYFFYNNNKSLIIIDIANKKYQTLDNLSYDIFLINENNDSLYYYNNYNIYSLNDNKILYTIKDTILNIKNIDFITNEYLFIQTYNSTNYILNLTNNEYTLIDNYILYSSIYKNTLYYTYYANDNTLLINSYKDNVFTSFSIKRVEFQSFIVNDDYLYLILDNSIQKVSLSRKKTNEVLNMSGYTSFIYDLNNIIIYNELTIFSKTFASLLRNNVFITDSMDILSRITNNEIYKAILYKTINNIVKGEKISEAFKDHWAVPDVAYYMIVTGESTGDLANMMQKVSEYYQLLHKNIINSLKSFIEPIMISILALVVGAIIIAVIVPMFDMYAQIQNG